MFDIIKLYHAITGRIGRETYQDNAESHLGVAEDAQLLGGVHSDQDLINPL